MGGGRGFDVFRFKISILESLFVFAYIENIGFQIRRSALKSPNHSEHFQRIYRVFVSEISTDIIFRLVERFSNVQIPVLFSPDGRLLFFFIVARVCYFLSKKKKKKTPCRFINFPIRLTRGFVCLPHRTRPDLC